MRLAISVEKRVAVAMYKLCSSAEDRSVANLFGLGRSTVNTIYREFCDAVVCLLEDKWINMPSPDAMGDHIREFGAVCDFPQAVGALDGCHFPVSPPKESAPDYYNYKGWHSIVLLALVDHRYRFRYVNVGSPGRCHDAYIYQRSQLAEFIEGPTFQAPAVVFSGTAVPPLILCDQAFPLTTHLIKPYRNSAHLDADMKRLNYHLSKARRVIENAFGRLKARFRFCMKRMECSMDTAPLVIRACCTLNNICEAFGDQVMQDWTSDAQVSEALYQQPQRVTDDQTATGAAVRAAILEYYKQRAQN
ncbi:uncharacterized protein LOC144132813 [Amblyomma americanum]